MVGITVQYAIAHKQELNHQHGHKSGVGAVVEPPANREGFAVVALEDKQTGNHTYKVPLNLLLPVIYKHTQKSIDIVQSSRHLVTTD